MSVKIIDKREPMTKSYDCLKSGGGSWFATLSS